MLRALGGCGQYVRLHHELFPTHEYPDGPPINSATCRAHHERFDWNWGLDRMMTYQGMDEVDRIYRSRADRYATLGTRGSQARRAAAFGYVFATQPQHRREVMNDLQRRRDELAEQSVRQDLAEAEQALADADRTIAEMTAIRERTLAELPTLRAAVENIAVNSARRKAEAKKREVAAAEEALRKLRTEAKRAATAAAKLAEATAAPEAAAPEATETTPEPA